MITRKTITKIEPNLVEGDIILLDKALYKSSFDCVYKVRRALQVQKVGHAGTLDPMATGLIIICTGRKTKDITEIQNLEKTYKGIITIGKTTPSYDSETEFDSENGFNNVNEEDIHLNKDFFIGKIYQTPPMYSAVKRNGKSLYHFARKGVELDRQAREVFVSRFEIEKIDLPDIHFEITCSKGTYIRSIANDFGKKLGCGAYLKNLRRIKIGNFSVEDALSINEFEKFAQHFRFAENETVI